MHSLMDYQSINHKEIAESAFGMEKQVERLSFVHSAANISLLCVGSRKRLKHVQVHSMKRKTVDKIQAKPLP
jgi:hypothetical protein